jgi:xylitol oxidase
LTVPAGERRPPRNWAGNLIYGAARILEPGSVDELRDVIRDAGRIRPLGTRHAFSDLADTTGTLISARTLPRRLELDGAARTVTVDGGATYGEVCGTLDAAGFALHNLASLPHISIAGACATATHGSGPRLGSLATAVRGVELVTPGGDLRRFERRGTAERAGATAPVDPTADGVVVSLGALGVVTAITLAVEPAYQVRQDVFENIGFDQVLDGFEDVMAAGASVSLFTDWVRPEFHQVWLKRRVDDDGSGDGSPRVLPAVLRDARRATTDVHPIPGMSPEACTVQRGIPGPWHERLPHFRMDHVPSAGDELQSEWFLARADAPAALAGLSAIRGRLAPLTLVTEVRTVAADHDWLSPATGRDSATIHFTWRPDTSSVLAVLPEIERILAPFDPRPHWGKLFGLAPERVRAAYPERARFVALAEELDPDRRLRNPFLDRYVFGPD